MEGFSTLFMRIPMCTTVLPIQGQCQVRGRKVLLKFPFTGIEFELPSDLSTGSETETPDDPPKCATSSEIPSERQTGTDSDSDSELTFKIRATNGDMLMTIHYVQDLQCFRGIGKSVEDGLPVVRFIVWNKESDMEKLKII